MKILPKICGKNFIHISDICDEMDRFIGANDVTIIQGTAFDPIANVTAVDSNGNILPFTVRPSELPSLCQLGTTTFTYQTETFVAQRNVTVIQAPLPTISLPTSSVTCDSEVCDAETDPNTIGVNETLDTLTGVTATDAHGNSLTVTCTEGSSVVYTSGGLKQLHYTATDACGNVGTATRVITVIAGSWEGISNVTLGQGTAFDPTEGVTAYDHNGNVVPFSVSPSTFAPCTVGTQTFTYEAQGLETATRTVTVTAISNPTISGVPSTTLEVEVGDTFDPLDGVTATDGNGNTITVTVSIEAVTYRTVIYNDGTLIINEKSTDIDANVAEHGTAQHIYEPLNSSGTNYVWTNEPANLWHESLAIERSITSVKIGSPIKPTSTAYWFYNLRYCKAIDLTNLDTSRVANMNYMFAYVGYAISTKDAVPYLDLSMFDTSNVTSMRYMFAHLYGAKVIDVSSWDTSAVTDMTYLFAYCNLTETIYASSQFVAPDPTQYGFFLDCFKLVGGSGTAQADQPQDFTTAVYARIDNPPTEPGYFTAIV